MMIMRHFPDLSSASVWPKQINFPLSMTSQKRYTELGIYVVTRHQNGISTLVSQRSFRGETCGGVTSCRPFSQASAV